MTLPTLSILVYCSPAHVPEVLHRSTYYGRATAKLEIKPSQDEGEAILCVSVNDRAGHRVYVLDYVSNCEQGLVIWTSKHLFVAATPNRVPSYWKVDLKRGVFLKGRFSSSDCLWKQSGQEVLFYERLKNDEGFTSKEVFGINIYSFERRFIRSIATGRR